MTSSPISTHMARISAMLQPFYQFAFESRFADNIGDPAICDFVYGNPHEMPLSEFVDALQRWVVPQNKDWFAYKQSEPAAQEIVAATLLRTHGIVFEPEDIVMTNGAFAALAITLASIVDPGDEVIYISPPWFFYEAQIATSQGVPVRVPCDRTTFDMDLRAIERAITPRTRAIIINSPNNPTGKVYPPETLRALSELLSLASRVNGRTIYLLSDEAYHRIVYDGRAFPSPTAYYSATFLIYTYGKTLLTPGQRIGYVALPPGLPEREQLRAALIIAQLVTGYAYPNALLQHALPDLEKLSIDVDRLQARRDRLVTVLSDIGYTLNVPEGTFYLLVRSPLDDDMAFIDLLADQGIFCLPGTVFELPGYFRISLTANDEMIERSIPGFTRALKEAERVKAVGLPSPEFK